VVVCFQGDKCRCFASLSMTARFFHTFSLIGPVVFSPLSLLGPHRIFFFRYDSSLSHGPFALLRQSPIFYIARIETTRVT
jgi:hypothetical protein